MELKGIVKGKKECRSFMEEGEFIREYFKTDRLTFGVSEIMPGKIGGLDPGHNEADEIFFCSKGHMLCYFPEEDKYYELTEGDALLIPQGVGHRLFNVGEEKGVIVWCCAPHP
ncbi:MAG: cupin domain-containing protein [Ruminiclostridium sp.]|nr:cupin domain-containing protein [Ruminiclostridium sp.]